MSPPRTLSPAAGEVNRDRPYGAADSVGYVLSSRNTNVTHLASANGRVSSRYAIEQSQDANRTNRGANSKRKRADVKGHQPSASQELERPRKSPTKEQHHSTSFQEMSNGSQVADPSHVVDMANGQDQYASSSPWPANHDGQSMYEETQLSEAIRNELALDPTASPSQSRQHLPGGIPDSAIQKQRKRNFTNRTKTGCLTCRERKKKCDEAKPACHNCQRGGFACKGYTQGAPLLKNHALRDHHPIQAKNANGAYIQTPAPYPPGYIPALGSGPNPYQQSEPDVRSITPTDDDRSQSRAAMEPSTQHVRSGYSRPHWSGHPMIAYPSDPSRTEYVPLPSANHEPRSLPPLLPPHQSHPPHPSHRANNSSQYGNAADVTNVAKMALQHDPAKLYRTEKEKMHAGKPFDPSDPELREHRQHCKKRVRRFNCHAETDSTGPWEAEHMNSFRLIIEPRIDTNSATDYQKAIPSGQVADRVQVEAPFNCDYGYNTEIGDDTEIGPNCHIMDANEVKIGARCIIGPNVSFYSQDHEHYLQEGQRRQDTKRLAVARRIVVEDDVFIGGGAIILSGVTIYHGATIGAGAVINKDVKPGYTAVDDRRVRYPTGAWATYERTV
ncbi:MAG: Maltose acetyltransferase [Chrysothrix sp. TS-e1954]|nr:MAG: Maltose acetyltransferase [Chrysothrix sp. TS-e1954]